MKRGTKFIIIAAFVVSVCLLNVGFAAWVLSNNTEGTVDGNISVEAVSDKSVTLEIDEATQAIHFGTPIGGSTNANAWLTPIKKSENENLVIDLILRTSKNIRNINVYFTETKNDKPSLGFEKAVELGLLCAPKMVVSDKAGGTSSEYFTVEDADGFGFTLVRSEFDFPTDKEDPRTKEVITLHLVIKFGWGEHFDYKNPYIYYGGKDYDEDITEAFTHEGSTEEDNVSIDTDKKPAKAHEDAFSSLYLLDSLVDGLAYKYTFKANSVL